MGASKAYTRWNPYHKSHMQTIINFGFNLKPQRFYSVQWCTNSKFLCLFTGLNDIYSFDVWLFVHIFVLCMGISEGWGWVNWRLTPRSRSFPYLGGERNMHYSDVIMCALASQITSLTIVYSIVYSDADQRKHQSSASLAFVREILPGKFPAQMASYAENVSIWWRHHV